MTGCQKSKKRSSQPVVLKSVKLQVNSTTHQRLFVAEWSLIHSFIWIRHKVYRNRIQKHRTKTDGETDRKETHTHSTALTMAFVEVDIIIRNRNLKLASMYHSGTTWQLGLQ